jgi:hypothetical protein
VPAESKLSATAGAVPGTPATHGRRLRLTKALLRGGVAAGPLSVAIFTLDGATRRDYHPTRHPVSALALGSRGWVQQTNFQLTGNLCLAAAGGLLMAGGRRRAAEAALVAAAGTGLIAAQAFPTDPVPGYPPDGPDPLPARLSKTGALHLGAAVLFFVGLPLAMISAARRAADVGERLWAAGSRAGAAVMWATAAMAGRGFSHEAADAGFAGIHQRLSIATGLGWLSVASGRELRQLS